VKKKVTTISGCHAINNPVGQLPGLKRPPYNKPIDAFEQRFNSISLSTRKTINEVMYETGYSDVKAFREVFRKITGLSPLEYITRYN